MKEKHLVLWSPGIENHEDKPSGNLGDLIIEEAVLREIKELFPGWKLSKVSTHLRFAPQQRALVRSADRIIVGGSNLLSSYMDGYFQWDLTLQNAFAARGAILMGAGWWRDQGTPNRYTKILLNTVLSWKGKHSVRDGQAQGLLKQAGIRKVLNTGCPTMWPLADMDTASIRTSPARKVLCMLTDYYPDPELDQALLTLLESNYETVYFWPQGIGDYLYINELKFGGVVLDRSLEALDRILKDEPDLDYVGTRLHGGVRCLINGKRCLTIEVDNRAREIGKETHIPTVERANLEKIGQWIKGSDPVRLNLRTDDIREWKGQFSG